ncbi:MAG: glycosyltransferase family 2 protein [Lachnospiraceae bacterium]
MSNLLIVIPAYNEEENIERVVNELTKHYPQFDYLIVNDGSRDKTAELCRARGYRMIDLPVNLGLAGAFQTGLKYAYGHGYEYALQFDGDGQHLPVYIQPMLNKIREGYDIVIASRYLTDKKQGSVRMMGSNLIQAALKLTTGITIHDPTSGMRMFSRGMIKEFALGLNYGPEPDTLSYLIKNGARVAEVQVIMQERLAGVSYLTPVNAVRYMIRMLVSILLIQNFRKREEPS